MAIDMAAIDEDNTLELELEHEIPSPKDTSQNPSCFQPSVEPEQEINATGHAVQKKRLTWKLLQQLPVPPSPLPEPLTAFEGILNQFQKHRCLAVSLCGEQSRQQEILLACIASIQTSQLIILTICCLLNLVDNSTPINETELSASVSMPLSLQDPISEVFIMPL